MAWDFSLVADRLGEALANAEAAIRLEQAVYGLDSKDELELQGVLAEGLGRHWTVAREVHYPSTVGRKLSHRQRCDLVLTPPNRPLLLEHRAPTLFDPGNPCPPEEALWLEVKSAYQFREGGVRHSGYGGQWRDAIIADLRKMEAEPRIRDGGLVLLVFTESEEIVQKDLELFEELLARREVLAGQRQARSIPILERIGHRLCTVAVWPTVHRGGDSKA